MSTPGSELKGKVGSWEFHWNERPLSGEGGSSVRVSGKREGAPLDPVTVFWKLDSQGVVLRLDDTWVGFDVRARQNDQGQWIYDLTERGGGREASGLRFLREGEALTHGTDLLRKKSTKVKAQMPGKIIKILVKVGDEVKKGDPIVIMEAMKMENEIRATRDGKVIRVETNVGAAVETGALLAVVE